MKFLDYKSVLEEHGYTVTKDVVTTRLGDVLAGFDPYGDYWCSDSKVQELFSAVPEKKKTGKKVRARTERGFFKKDNPNTPENEAWTTE